MTQHPDDPSPFERPEISPGYPLDDRERDAVERAVRRVPVPQPQPDQSDERAA